MSTPANYNPGGTPNYTPNEPKSNNMTTILGIAIAALLGLCVFLLVSKYKTSKNLEAAQFELSAKTTALDELDTQYKDVKLQLEQQLGINQELDAKINEQLRELENSKSQIARLIRQNKDYKAAMASFERQKTQYLAEIEELKQRVGLLTEDNTRLSNENQNLNASLADTRTRLEEESTAKAALISEKTQLESERKVLSRKVDIASAVRVKNITVKSVDVRSSGKERTKTRASKVDKLNICFTTEPNEIAPAGEEVFYIRIIDPTGAPLAIESLGSGISTDKRNESEFRYTTTAMGNYENGESNFCGVWQPGQNFVKGKYSVEVYNKGYLVGTGAFNLK